MATTNYSFISLMFTLALPLVPHWLSILRVMQTNLNGGWPNENPRSFVARLNAKAAMGKKLSDLEQFVLRGQAAQMNGWEWWPVWAAAVITGYLAKIPMEEMSRYSAAHVSCRVIFTALFMTTTNRTLSYLRTLVFLTSLIPCYVIFQRAAAILIY